VVAKQLELAQEAKYIRLVQDKIVYITEAEALAEEVLAVTGDRLGEQARLVSEANRLKERIGFIHQAMREDGPSQFEADYDMLWYQYWEVAYQLRLINPEFVDQFRDKVAARVEELAVRINAICDDGDDPDYLDGILACYEVTADQAFVLGWNLDLSYSFTLDERGTILAIWRQEGKPAIPLSHGRKCADLEKFLSVATNGEYVLVRDWARSVALARKGKGD